MDPQTARPSARRSVADFCRLWTEPPACFASLDTPEAIIELLGELGFETAQFERVPWKTLPTLEQHESGQMLVVGNVAHLYEMFDRDAAYTRAYLACPSTVSATSAELRRVYRAGVGAGYAARLLSSGMSAAGIIAAWEACVSEEYAAQLA